MNDKTPNFEVPAEMREFAERSIEQARKAMDGFVSAAMKAADTFEGSSSTAGTKHEGHPSQDVLLCRAESQRRLRSTPRSWSRPRIPPRQ